MKHESKFHRWWIASGFTLTKSTGPPFDHTTFSSTGRLKGHRQPQVFAGLQTIGAIFCSTENGADSLHADIATAPTSYKRAIAVDGSFFTIGIGTIRRDI